MDKSPFPGMDPYLEGELWPEFHDRLAHQISAQLMPHLRPKYVALLERRYFVEQFDLGVTSQIQRQEFYPDVHVAQIKEAVVDYEAMTAPAAELTSPVLRQKGVLSLEIRDVAQRRLVTVIEILSPTNKQGPGFNDYMNKRSALLHTQTHLLEIDLLRAGRRLPLTGGKLPPAPYYVFLSRFTKHPRTAVWPCSLREPLPTVPVPLLPPDEDAPLALQPALAACFELVGYQALLDYSQPPPPPPFDSEDLTWIETTLKEAQ